MKDIPMNKLGIEGMTIRTHHYISPTSYDTYSSYNTYYSSLQMLSIGAYFNDPVIKGHLLDLGAFDYLSFIQLTRFLIYNHVKNKEFSGSIWLTCYENNFSHIVDNKKREIFYNLRDRYILASKSGREYLAKLPEFREVLESWHKEQKKHSKKERKSLRACNKAVPNYGASNYRDYWNSVKNLRK